MFGLLPLRVEPRNSTLKAYDGQDNLISFQGPVCPVPLHHKETIVMGHGSGGKMTNDLINQVFRKYFSNPVLDAGNDFANVTFQMVRGTYLFRLMPILFPLLFFREGTLADWQFAVR